MEFSNEQINNFAEEACDDPTCITVSSSHRLIHLPIYCKLFSTGDLVHKMLNTFDMQELSGTLTRTQPGNFQETL